MVIPDEAGIGHVPQRFAALVHGSRALGEPRSTSWPSWRQQVHDLDMKSRVHPKYKTKYHVGNWPHLPPAQHDLTRRMPRSRRLARRLMRIPWPTDGGPILVQHGFEYLQARRDDQLLELGLRVNEDIDQRQVPWRRGYRLATARDCARLLLHGGSLLGGLHLGFVTGRIARPVKSRRFTFQQLLGHPPAHAMRKLHSNTWSNTWNST